MFFTLKPLQNGGTVGYVLGSCLWSLLVARPAVGMTARAACSCPSAPWRAREPLQDADLLCSTVQGVIFANSPLYDRSIRSSDRAERSALKPARFQQSCRKDYLEPTLRSELPLALCCGLTSTAKEITGTDLT